MKPTDKITFQENFYKAMPKVLYLFWDQGWDQAPELVQRCARSWERWNPDYVVRRLTRHDLREQLPEFFSRFGRLKSLLMRRSITIQALSDLLRIRLLDCHGGIWADQYDIVPQASEGLASRADAPWFFCLSQRSRRTHPPQLVFGEYAGAPADGACSQSLHGVLEVAPESR